MKKMFLLFLVPVLLPLISFAQDNSDKVQIMEALKEKWMKKNVVPLLEKHVTENESSIHITVETSKESPVIHTYFFPDSAVKAKVRTVFHTDSYDREGGEMKTALIQDKTIFLKGFFIPSVVKTEKIKNFNGKVMFVAQVPGTFLVFATNKTLKFGKEIEL